MGPGGSQEVEGASSPPFGIKVYKYRSRVLVALNVDQQIHWI